MRALKHHPEIVMRDDAADAIDAMEDKHGPIRINRGSVSEAVQQSLIDRWDAGGPGNRPPALFEPKRPARASDHVQGIGLDVYNYTDDRPKLKEFGYRWYGPSDPVHYTFIGWTPPKPAPTLEEESDMVKVTINGKKYLVAPRFIKHIKNPEADADFQNITNVRQFELTDKRRGVAWANLLDGYGIPEGTLNAEGLVRGADGKYAHANVWAGDMS